MVFTKAQIFITRRCNLSCPYCKISRKDIDELSLEEWKKAVSIVGKLGIRFLKIMGGEPTLRQDLEDLIRFIKENTQIDVGVFTNSVLSDRRLDSLVEAGMDQYITSIDTVDVNPSFQGDNIKKSCYGLKALLYLQSKGFSNLRANIIVGTNNIQRVPQIVRYLSERGVYSSLTPVHVGKGDFWEYRCHSNELELNPEDKPKVDDLVRQLLEMKSEGVLIANSEEFITDWSNYAIGTSWHCKVPPVLWVDADGKMMCCLDIRGKASSLSIFDLKGTKKYNQFLELIKEDAKRCPGCFYNCQYDWDRFV